MSKLQDILDELQAQVEEGYAGPVNGWTTLKTEALSQISQLVDGCIPDKKPDHPKSIYNYNNAIDEIRNNLRQKGFYDA